MLTPNTWKRFSFPEKPPKVLLQNQHAKSRGPSRSQSHRKTPCSKADMTMLCRSHSAGCKTPIPAAGDHRSGAHIRLSRVEGGCRALKFPTPKAIQSDLQQPTKSILPSTILILPPLIWASHPTEMAGPAGEIFISIQAGRRGWGLLHPRNQAKQGRTVGFTPHIQTPTPALRSPGSPIQGCRCSPPTHRSPHHLLLLSEKVTPLCLATGTNARQQAQLIDASQLPPRCHAAMQRPAVTTTGAAGDVTDLRRRDAPQSAALALARCRTPNGCVAPFSSSQTPSLQVCRFLFVIPCWQTGIEMRD